MYPPGHCSFSRRRLLGVMGVAVAMSGMPAQGQIRSTLRAGSKLDSLLSRSLNLDNFHVSQRALTRIRNAPPINSNVTRASRRLADDGVGAARVTRSISNVVGVLSADDLRFLESLTDTGLDFVTVMTDGGSEIRAVFLGDVLKRRRLAFGSGPGGLIASSVHGPSGVRALSLHDTALRFDRVRSAAGEVAPNLGSVGELLAGFTDQQMQFWQRYVEPNYDVWAAGSLALMAGGAVQFVGEDGEFTEAGREALIEQAGPERAQTVFESPPLFAPNLGRP